MNTEQLNSWLQTGTGIAILIGLVLVIWELQQNREAAQSQLTTEGWHMVNQTSNAMLGESPAKVLAKSCDAPETLTTEDLIVLDQYFSEVLNHRVIRLVSLTKRGSFVSDEYWRSDLGQWHAIFQYPVGRAWWSSKHWKPDIQKFGDEVLSDWKPKPCTNPDWLTKTLEETNRV